MINEQWYKAVVKKVDYNPDTGEFTLKRNGKDAGSFMANGYRTLSAYAEGKCKNLLAHRVAWFITHGVIPKEIDHINRVRSDNRMANLRKAGRQDQAANTGMFSHNTSGAKGVSWDKSRGKWESCIKVNQRKKHLGRFAEFDDAVKARKEAEQLYFNQSFLESESV